MALTWKDLITTLLGLATFGLYYALSKGINLPLISGYRAGIIALAVIGIGMCAFSSAAGATGPFITIASMLGVIAFGLIVYGLIAGTKLAFVLQTITILVLWAVSTLRHVIGA